MACIQGQLTLSTNVAFPRAFSDEKANEPTVVGIPSARSVTMESYYKLHMSYNVAWFRNHERLLNSYLENDGYTVYLTADLSPLPLFVTYPRLGEHYLARTYRYERIKLHPIVVVPCDLGKTRLDKLHTCRVACREHRLQLVRRCLE